MRAIVGSLFLSILLLPCLGMTKPILLIKVKGHYGIQHTAISKEAAGWACKTEITPYHFSSVRPFSDLSLLNLRNAYGNAMATNPACRDSVVIEDSSARVTKKYSGCADQIFFASFLREVNRHCGRN